MIFRATCGCSDKVGEARSTWVSNAFCNTHSFYLSSTAMFLPEKNTFVKKLIAIALNWKICWLNFCLTCTARTAEMYIVHCTLYIVHCTTLPLTEAGLTMWKLAGRSEFSRRSRLSPEKRYIRGYQLPLLYLDDSCLSQIHWCLSQIHPPSLSISPYHCYLPHISLFYLTGVHHVQLCTHMADLAALAFFLLTNMFGKYNANFF